MLMVSMIASAQIWVGYKSDSVKISHNRKEYEEECNAKLFSDGSPAADFVSVAGLCTGGGCYGRRRLGDFPADL